MNENKRTWDEKIKLILGELENKISAESAGRGSRKKSHKRKYHTKEEKKRAAFCQDIILQATKSAAFLLATVALVQGIVGVLPASITVSNTVNGRELPIYCVETEKKQVALSFDAAWVGGLLRSIEYS